MMLCRKRAPSQKIKLGIVSALALAAAAAASGGYIARERGQAAPADGGRFAGIEPIYRQILKHSDRAGAPGELAPAVRDGMRRPATDFLRIEDYWLRAEIEPITEMNAAGAGSRRHTSAYGSEARRRFPVRAFAADSQAFTLVFNGSFASLFANLFDARDAARPHASGEDRNPFTEAKEEEQAGRSAAPAEAAPAKTEKSGSEAAPPPPETENRSASPAVSGQPAAEDVFVFLGDFDGSGVLGSAEARRTGESEFDFGGSSKSFRLLVNPAAVEEQRSFGIEDIDGDGIMDLAVTARASLVGGVLLGEAGGGFRGAGFFLTGYEPTVAAFGSMTEEGRHLISVNLRTGVATTFRRRGGYTQYRASRLNVPPDYVARIVEPASGLDYLLAGREGMQPHLYRLTADGRCEPLPHLLPDAPTVDLGPDSRRASGVGGLRVYQVGAYASVILADAAGRTFNVANLRVSPGLFLVFGNLERRGSLDVGVARLAPSAPGR